MDLAHTLVLPDGSDRRHGILLVHGWNSTRRGPASTALALAADGHTCLAVDLPGHGESPGDVSELSRPDYLSAIADAHSVLSSTGVASVSLVGASFGGYLCAVATRLLPVRSLVLRAPADYPDAHWDRPMPEAMQRIEAWRRLSRLDREPSAAMRAVSVHGGRFLVVEMGADEVIPSTVIDDYVEASPDGERITMADAPHAIGPTPHQQRFEHLLVDWFSRP